ncbi:MAG TPA: cobyrinate a,c-diamide synthase [Pseudonocardiaceae bacterium]|nr:cobyrinate a,c-diamide synthase [Pseudonocardiaceae bacterium]
MPRLVIAAPASGSGKTTVTTGLIAALRRRGRRVAPFKVGPDYIDPGYHRLAADRPGRNLDPVLVGEQRICPLFAHGAAGADIAVIEGVMGLFDGRTGAAGFGSTAHVATLLDAPVLLVVDARGQGRSLAALLHGFRGYDPAVRIAGVLLNQVGSIRHEQVLRDACAEIGLPVFGALGRTDTVHLPSRHLGLVPAAEHGGPARQAVAAMAALVTRSVDLDEVQRLADTAPALATRPWDPAAEIGGARQDGARKDTVDGPVLAVAGGAAFTFGYQEQAELFAAAGARVELVDPLRDESLPDGTAAVVLPGGFPEQHAADLSANTALRDTVATFARSGGVVHAECGGLLYLVRELDGHPMAGVLDATAAMRPTLTLGYRDAVAAGDSVPHRAGERITGHEFHRTQVMPGAGDHPAWHWRDSAGEHVTEGFSVGRVHASYLHTHAAAHPETISRLVTAAGAVLSGGAR